MRMLSVGMILSIIFYIGSYLWVVVLNIKIEKYKNLLFNIINLLKEGHCKKEDQNKKEDENLILKYKTEKIIEPSLDKIIDLRFEYSEKQDKSKDKEVEKEYFEIFMEKIDDCLKEGDNLKCKIESLICITKLKKYISLGLCSFSLIFQFILVIVDKGEQNLLKTNGSLENIMILILIIIIFGIFLLGMNNFYKKTIEIFLVICFSINISLIWEVEKKPLNNISKKVKEEKISQSNIIQIFNSNEISEEKHNEEEDICKEENFDKYVAFDFNKAILTPSGYLRIHDLGKILENKKYRLELYGYTDSVGEKEYNKKLREKRAKIVKEQLINNGLKAENIEIIEKKGYNISTETQIKEPLNRIVYIKVIIEK